MSINSELIKRKEEINQALEKYADEALLKDVKVRNLEKGLDDVQSALIYILNCFNISSSKIYGFYSIEDLVTRHMEAAGVMYRKAEDLEYEAKDRTQYILCFDKKDKPYVLRPSIIGYRCYDPTSGRLGFATSAVVRSMKRECYVFTQPLTWRSSVLLTFITSILRYLSFKDVALLLLSSAAMTGLGLVIPKINQWIYSVYLKDPQGQLFMFRMMLGLFLSLSIVNTVISLLKSRLLSGIRNRISIKVQGIVMAKILELPRSFFSNNSSGKISKRITQCNSLTSAIVNIFLDILLNFSFSSAYLIQMNNISRDLFIPALIFSFIRVVFAIITSFWEASISRETLSLSMESDSFFYSAIKGIMKIKSLGVEKKIYAKWADMYRKILHNSYSKPFLLRYQSLITSALSTITTITLMGKTVLSGLTREDYMIFSSSFAMMSSVINTLISTMSSIFRMKTMADNIAPIFEYETQSDGNKEFVSSLRGEIRAENIHFSYDSGQVPCLNSVSLNIRPGEKVALVGESGCGKSTLLKILMGMEKADSGIVYYDDKDISNLNMRSLRQKIGSVFQFSKLFPGTIYDNVTFGCFEEVNEEIVWDGLRKACIAEYVANLPLGLNTEISQSNSSGFSGGQRQQLLLARALIRKPKVLILDEATSALDNITQKEVLESILKLNSTVVMVAHRISTVIHFDRIIMLKNGRIAESGTYDKLMAGKGLFAELVSKQLIEEKEKGEESKPGEKTA